jgi:hypothetical protein
MVMSYKKEGGRGRDGRQEYNMNLGSHTTEIVS